MSNYSIIISETTDPFAAIHAAITCAKALNIEWVEVKFRDGTFSLIRKDSNVLEALEVYNLRSKVAELQKKLKP
jgi:hypothetical protein